MTIASQMSLLTEGITHIEDLDLKEFIRAVSNIAKMQATEKLDGANLWFGLDEEGHFYTSRAGKAKSAENIYSEAEYPYLSSSNGFRAAHAALEAKVEDIKKILRPGNTVEIEVLYRRQPNAVTYGAGGKNYIAFLRGVEGTPDILVDQLSNALNNTSVQVQVKTVETTDGETLKLEDTSSTFQFVGVQKIDTAHLKTTDVSNQLAALQKYLQTPAGIKGSNATNFDVVTSSLGSFDKEIRPAIKELKNSISAKIMTDFKLPIKKELLDKFVAKVKSPLAADDLSPEEDLGIEGVVLKDPDSGEQIKLVDKDTFTTVNKFNFAVRAGISNLVKTTDPEASLESRGGIMGVLKITIADLLGNKDLARGASAKKIFNTVKGKTPEETVRNVAKELSGGEDYRGTKRKILALIDNTRQQLAKELKDFKDNQDQFQLKLKNGKTIGLTAEVIRRTLLSFAEAKRDLDELTEKIGKTKALPQLVALLYGRTAKAVHEVEGEPVTEAIVGKEWMISMHPTESSNDEDAHIQEKKIITALASKAIGGKNGIKLKEIHDDGGYTFEIKSDPSVTESSIWDALADMEVDWGGSIVCKMIREELLTEKRVETSIGQYQGKDAWTILNIYLATYMMARVIYEVKDKPGLRLLRDRTHMRLKKWGRDMSPLNFWGYAVWRSGTPAVKKLIGAKASHAIFSQSRHCPPAYWKFLHMDMSFSGERHPVWEDHAKAITVLQRVAGMNYHRINSLLKDTFNYSNLTFDEKVKFHSRLFYFTQQFIAISPLAVRLRVIGDNLLLNANGENEQMTENLRLLKSVVNEDGDAGAVGAADVSSNPQPMGQKRIIVKHKRNKQAVNGYKFPWTNRPDRKKP